MDNDKKIDKMEKELRYVHEKVINLKDDIEKIYKIEKSQDNINNWTVKCMSNLCKGWIATTIAILGLAIYVIFFK